MSSDLGAELALGPETLETVHKQITSLVQEIHSQEANDIETAAACAMLHSFYTEMEKILKLIARDWDDLVPSPESWHKELLNQMSSATDKRQAILDRGLVETLGEFLAFRHLFRGASIALMRWNKLSPLVAKVDDTFERFKNCIDAFRDACLP